jgi:preprotein translocase subunit SecY
MNWKIIGRSLTHKDMRGRILAVLGILLVFRILAHIPVPLSNPETLHQVLQNLFNSNNTPQLLSFINVLSGGALANFSIMIAGLGPYINASIIMQLLTKAIPQLETLHKEGEFGQKKINQYTRILTFPLAIIQSIGSIYLIRQAAQSIGGIGDITANAGISQWILMVAALTGGSMLLMWLGELVTEQSVGNGISLLITVGIVSRLPSDIANIVGSVLNGKNHWHVFGHSIWHAYIYPITYFLLVFIFTFFYTSITFNSKEIAENLHKQGGFIEGVRSGLQTEKYLSRIVNRLTLFGAISLGFLALLPIIAQLFITTSITIGGTSILILVSVALQTLRAVESRALMVTYDQYSQPDYFTDTSGLSPGAGEALAVKRPVLLRWVPARKRKSSK